MPTAASAQARALAGIDHGAPRAGDDGDGERRDQRPVVERAASGRRRSEGDQEHRERQQQPAHAACGIGMHGRVVGASPLNLGCAASLVGRACLRSPS
jgi:hypothetical protein